MSQYSIADWHLLPLEGGLISATNNHTKEKFEGTVAEFNAKMLTPAPSALGDTGSFQFIFDDVNPFLTYVGKAPVTALETLPMWSIARYVITGNKGVVTFAVGSSTRNAIWADRASLNYL